MQALKLSIHGECIRIVSEKIELVEKELKKLDDSQASETKSSMGDKYETSREMMQRERDNLLGVLHTNKSQLALLSNIDLTKVFIKVEVGTLAHTSLGYYFLSVGLGKIQIDGQDIFVISPQSPIGKLLISHKLGDALDFNGQKLIVHDLG